MSPSNSVLLSRRHLLRWSLLAAALPLPRAFAADAAPLLLMAGAGYKRPAEALCAAFTRETGIPVERSYGNLQQVFAQIRASGRVDVLLGEADFVEHAKDLDLPQRLPLGDGILVLAWRRDFDMPQNLLDVQSVAMPNPQQAIYGRAAQQWLQAQGLWDGLQSRLKVVQTVPQVSAYLTSGQIDAGFVNLTEALAIKDQLGGMTVLKSGADSYAPIHIVAAFPAEGAQPDTASSRARFAQFLQSARAHEILRKAGL
jgi:molybdate transport system substrate-binding protein